MVAAALRFGALTTEVAMEPIIAMEPVEVAGYSVRPGACLGMRQTAYVRDDERIRVNLELEMSLGLAEPGDAIDIDGRPPISMRIPGGVAGDLSTAAIAVNAARVIGRLRPGLRSMAEVPISSLVPPDGVFTQAR